MKMENTVTTSRIAAATEGSFRPVLLDTNLRTLALLARTRECTPTGLQQGLVLSALDGLASFLTGSASQTEIAVTAIKQTTPPILLGSRFARSESAAPLLTCHFDRVFLARSLPLIEPVSGPKRAKLNRQTPEVETLLSYRKQTAATCSNRQKIKTCFSDTGTAVSSEFRIALRPHHFRSGPGDESARRQSLTFFHQFVQKSGNNVGLSRSECFQTDTRWLICRLGGSENSLGLFSDLLKFGVGGPRAKRANTHTRTAQLFRHALRERKVESLRGSVNSAERDRLERRQRGHDQYIAVLARHHQGQIEARKPHHCGAIHLNHLQHFLHGNFVHVPECPKARIVNQQFHFDVFPGRKIEDFGRRLGSQQVRGNNLNFHSMLGGKLRRDILQTISAPRRQHQIRAAGRKQLCELKPDPGARSSNQRPFPGPSFQRVVCHRFLQ